MATLGGSIFCYNGISQDYCIKEAIQCLEEFCDEVVVVDAGSIDGTLDYLYGIVGKNTTIISCSNNEWQSIKGSEKLSYFTNIAIGALNTDYNFNLQADEILHEDSYDAVRRAIETGNDAFMCSRINLWASPYKMLDVPHERKPCSTQIVRLAKSSYHSYSDAESLMVREADFNFLNDIRIFHMGFVRKKEIHPSKIRHMQSEVFNVGVDKKLDGMEIFDPYKWFDESDLKPIQEPLPKIIQAWAKERE